jgi:transcription elongation factor Elf1
MTIEAWVRTYAALADGKEPRCPVCGSERVRFRFVGDLGTRLSMGMLWCETCERGARLSRLRVPEHLKMYGWEDKDALSGVRDFIPDDD